MEHLAKIGYTDFCILIAIFEHNLIDFILLILSFCLISCPSPHFKSLDLTPLQHPK